MGGTMSPASPLSTGSLAQLTLSLVAVVGLIFAISWLLKRFRIVLPRSRGEISVIDQLQHPAHCGRRCPGFSRRRSDGHGRADAARDADHAEPHATERGRRDPNLRRAPP
jgi:hypothetical protein